MNNAIKAALVATTAIVAAGTASAGSINDVKTQMEKYGVNTSNLDFSSLADNITVDSTYSDQLIARDAWEADKTDFDALDAYLDAVDAWDSAGGNTVAKGSGWDGALEGILEAAIDTEVASLEAQIETFNDNYGDASGVAAGIYIDGVLNNSNHQRKVGKHGINMIYTTLGKDMKYDIGIVQSAYTSNLGADKAVNDSNDFTGKVLAVNLSSKLGLSGDFSADAADASIEVSADLTDYVQDTDWELALNSDGTAYEAVAKDGSTFFANNAYIDSSVDVINFKTESVSAFKTTMGGKTYTMRDLINETGTFANVAE